MRFPPYRAHDLARRKKTRQLNKKKSTIIVNS